MGCEVPVPATQRGGEKIKMRRGVRESRLRSRDVTCLSPLTVLVRRRGRPGHLTSGNSFVTLMYQLWARRRVVSRRNSLSQGPHLYWASRVPGTHHKTASGEVTVQAWGVSRPIKESVSGAAKERDGIPSLGGTGPAGLCFPSQGRALRSCHS